MSVTLQDIADICNLSRPTVSRALRDDPLINIKTREKIQKVAAQLEYQPNLIAASLRNSKSNTIWLVLESLRDVLDREIVQHATNYLAEKGYDTVAAFHMENEERYVRITNRLFQGVADGALIIPRRLGVDFEVLRKIPLRKYPAVLMDVDVEGLGLPLVTTDNNGAARELVSEAKKLGCNNFILLHHLPNLVASQRRDACVSEIEKFGKWTCAQNISKEYFAAMPKDKPIAIIADAQSDILSFAEQWRSLLSGRKNVFCCFDEWIGDPTPARTVLVSIQDCEGIAKAAVDILLETLSKKGSPSKKGPRRIVKLKRRELKIVGRLHE